MIAVENHILGRGRLHVRLCAMTEIMAEFVSSAPHAVGIAQLTLATGRRAKAIAKLCACLCLADLLLPDPCMDGSWNLACEPGAITLEDVFRCILAEQQTNAKPVVRLAKPNRSNGDVDLLVTQAMIEINQSVLMHLRQFSLDRIKIGASGMLAPACRRFSNASLDDLSEVRIAITARDTNFVLPV